MQAKNLEELELQQPFLERTLRPFANRMSGSVSRMASSSFSERTEKRLALAGNPGDMRVADWLGIKAIGAIVGAILFFFLFVIVGLLGFPVVHRLRHVDHRRASSATRSRSSGWVAASRSARRPSC